MPNEQIFTDREIEAIYEYSDNESRNLAREGAGNPVIELFFNGGTRMLKITDGKDVRNYELVSPKKPEDTGGVLLLFQTKEFFVPDTVASELEAMFPGFVQKATSANRHKESVG